MKGLLCFLVVAVFAGSLAQNVLHWQIPIWVLPSVLAIPAILLPLSDATQRPHDRAARRERSMHPVPWEKP
jgi:hypothetical protein